MWYPRQPFIKPVPKITPVQITTLKQRHEFRNFLGGRKEGTNSGVPSPLHSPRSSPHLCPPPLPQGPRVSLSQGISSLSYPHRACAGAARTQILGRLPCTQPYRNRLSMHQVATPFGLAAPLSGRRGSQAKFELHCNTVHQVATPLTESWPSHPSICLKGQVDQISVVL